MLEIGVTSASVLAIAISQVCVLNCCAHEAVQHVCTTEMFNTIVQINLAGHKEKGLFLE